MADRLYTRGGDAGETSLADGTRVRKDDPRVEACGAVDEAASAIGLARAAVSDTPLDLALAFAQQRLLTLAGILAGASASADAALADSDVATLERTTDDLLDAAGGSHGFVLPGGGEAGARLQLARAVVRRAERRVLPLVESGAADPLALRFLNRLSDALYAAALYANALDGVAEEPWEPGHGRSGD